MDQPLALWLLVALAACTANLPFLTERVLGLWRWPGQEGQAAKASKEQAGVKPFWLRLLELLFFYGVVGFIGMAIEARLGNRHPQGWPFYVITASLYLVMAYPGYVYRYLRKSRS